MFYEVFVRSFKDSDGDGKGDLKGLIEKLDYLNDGDPTTHTDLGVTAIWLMPIQQSPSYHGYDVTDYRTVEQDYGSNQDFKNFIDSAHNRGIKVIIDYVMNHTSSQHPWFVESAGSSTAEKRDWYLWQNPKPVVTGPWGQVVWHSKNASNYYGIFWSEMPDLNYNKPEVKAEMFDVARFWLEDMNVDGFRLDAIKYIKENGNTLEDTPETIAFWNEFKDHYKSINPDALAVGEAWTTTQKIKDYMTDTSLDYCFEFDLADAILNVANTPSAANVTAIQAQVDEVIAAYPYLQYGTFLTNHDVDRVMNRLGSSVAKAKIAASLLFTLPGVPYIYYGEEIGMTGAKPDENIRTPLQWNSTSQAGFTTGTPWRPVNADYTGKNIESQKSDAASLWNHYRKLIAIRNNQAALRKGTYKMITASNTTVFSFLRQYQDENIIVVSNPTSGILSNVQLSLTQSGIGQGSYTLVDLQGGNQVAATIDANGDFSNLTISSIPARATLIYKLLAPTETTTDVAFQVDMNAMITGGGFAPATETVDIVADFNGFGSGSTTTLTDADEDGIYSVTVSALNIGSKINYKYRINATNDARTEFASSIYLREYFVPDVASTVTDIYQSEIITGLRNSVHHSIANVYPVPSAKELFIDFPDNITGAIHYQISDLLGGEKVSSSFVSAGGQHSLSCEDLSTGVYLLTLAYNGTSQVFRIVVQK